MKPMALILLIGTFFVTHTQASQSGRHFFNRVVDGNKKIEEIQDYLNTLKASVENLSEEETGQLLMSVLPSRMKNCQLQLTRLDSGSFQLTVINEMNKTIMTRLEKLSRMNNKPTEPDVFSKTHRNGHYEGSKYELITEGIAVLGDNFSFVIDASGELTHLQLREFDGNIVNCRNR